MQRFNLPTCVHLNSQGSFNFQVWSLKHMAYFALFRIQQAITMLNILSCFIKLNVSD